MTAQTRQSGFSLSEALMALAVSAIGLSIAAPSLQSLTSRNQLAGSVNQLVSTLHLARSEAVMRNMRVSVCASADGETCDSGAWEAGWITFIDTDGNQQRSASEPLLERVAGLQGLEVSSAEFRHVFSYRPNGRTVSSTGVDTTGEFALCEPGSSTVSRVVIVRNNGIPTLTNKRRDGSVTGCNPT